MATSDAARSSSPAAIGTATTSRPGRANAAPTTRAASAWSGASGAAAAPAAGRQRRRQRPAFEHAVARPRQPATCHHPPAGAGERVHEAGIDVGGQQHAGVAGRPPQPRQRPANTLQGVEPVAQVGRLLEPAVGAERCHPLAQAGERAVAVLALQPRRRGSGGGGVGGCGARRRGRGRGSGPAARPCSCRRPRAERAGSCAGRMRRGWRPRPHQPASGWPAARR